MDNSLINDLLIQIKKNKKYKTISDDIVLLEIKNYLSKNKIDKISKEDIKEIRNTLHRSYSSFQTRKKNKIQDYFDELKKDTYNLDVTDKLLGITLSTKERIKDYKFIYDEIFRITGAPKTIVDLGSGFNIFSYPFMELPSVNYYAYDINEKDIDLINSYMDIMKKNGLSGKAAILDLRNIINISYLPSSDIIFLFKVIDVLDQENHKPSEDLINSIISKTKFIVASFATKTLTRKPMNKPQRLWFDLMLKRNNLKFQTFKTEGELFYIISK